MGNTPVKRTPTTTGPSSTLRRSQSSHVPASGNRRRPSTATPDASGEGKPMPAARAIRRQSSRGFHSAMNIAANGHTETVRAQPIHPAPEKYMMSAVQRDMIRGNWEPNRDRRYDISRRIYGRAFNRRPDVREVFEQLGAEVWAEEANKFADFMDAVVQNIDDLCTLERLSLEVGRRHSDWRQRGFKPEFWVALAESMIKECCYLDAAVHPAGEVLEAWSKVVGLTFGWVRDGYYENVRLQRRMSRKTISIVTKSTSISSRSLSNSSRSNSVDEHTLASGTADAVAINGTTLPAIEAVGTPPSDSITLT